MFFGRFVDTMKRSEPTDQDEAALRLHLIKKVERLSRRQTVKLLGLIDSWLAEEKEPRTHSRKECSIPVDCCVNGNLCKDYIENLSSVGCFVRSQKFVLEHAKATMSFSLPNFAEPFKVHGRVVWTGVSGFGVQFDQEDPYLAAILLSL